MMEIDEPPGCGRSGQRCLQPDALDRVARVPVGIIGVAVQAEDLNRPITILVIPFVSGKREVCEVRVVSGRRRIRETAVVIPHGRKEAIGNCPGTVCSCVRENIIVEKLSDILVDGAGFTVGIVVVADGHNEIGVPALHQIGHGQLIGSPGTIITDHSNDHRGSIGQHK